MYPVRHINRRCCSTKHRSRVRLLHQLHACCFCMKTKPILTGFMNGMTTSQLGGRRQLHSPVSHHNEISLSRRVFVFFFLLKKTRRSRNSSDLRAPNLTDWISNSNSPSMCCCVACRSPGRFVRGPWAYPMGERIGSHSI